MRETEDRNVLPVVGKRISEEPPSGEGLSAGGEEVGQINPGRKLSSAHCTVHIQRERRLKILPPNQTICFPLTAHRMQ